MVRASQQVSQQVQAPVFRRLRVFALDPGTPIGLETALRNEKIIDVPWEGLSPGPVGEYVAVVDTDQTGTVRFPPVDLDDPTILAQSGLAPTDGNPQFRQQMLYAVAMDTVRRFESALGRVVLWRATHGRAGSGPQYRHRLALHPHWFESVRTVYDRTAGGCFGYGLGAADSPDRLTVLFTSLSQDSIAVTLTRALLDGLGVELGTELGDTLPNLVALCQHFGDGDVLRARMAALRGDLDQPEALAMLAPQVGGALGRPPGGVHGPEGDGDVLLNAVFQGLTRIYAARVADLRRIASQGTGILPPGRPHPDLVARFSAEASRAAGLVQQMCLRALDYLPPVNVELTDFVRALVTADIDLYPGDEQRYRIAMLEALRGGGIDSGRATFSPDTMVWHGPPDPTTGAAVTAFVRELSGATTFWNLPVGREDLWRAREIWKRALAARLRADGHGLGPVDVTRRFEVTAFDLRQRTGLGGALTLDWVIRVVQGPPQRRVGCTLIVDAQSGQIRYFIAKPEAMPALGPDDDLLLFSQSVVAPPPARRRLRVFASDPSLGTQLETAGVNEVTLSVRWDRGGPDGSLAPGPVGEYLEVIDHDPASGCFYAPVDLNAPGVLAQDGLTPSESNPQFHQQMVYAVAMRVVEDFERALGRRVLWSPRLGAVSSTYGSAADSEEYVQRLRIHPHALREANAYYSPSKKALLFGYFPSAAAADLAPLTVFTCVSQDIVAHETTHALLDGIHQLFDEPSNLDVLAFHEAFADLVALFGHFSQPEVLREQIASTRGDLQAQSRLGELAQQFGQAIGRRGALRSAIGAVDPQTGQWSATPPDPTAYLRVTEAHDRGAILVAAVFDAFLTIYKARVADLLRVATQGTGVLPDGQIHPDLVARLSDEASGAAKRVQSMCIRALDYCPPVDIRFGDYLRALVTADYAANPVDERHDRVAFVEAFRRYGIVPDGIRSLSVDGLLWQPTSAAPDQDEDVVVPLVKQWAVDIDSWHLSQDRETLYTLMCRYRLSLQGFLQEYLGGRSQGTGRGKGSGRGKVQGAGTQAPHVVGGLDPTLSVAVRSVRPTLGTDWNGRPTLHWVIELVQSVDQYLEPPDADDASRAADPSSAADASESSEPDFVFRGGCTLIVDARTGKVRYSITKPMDDVRLARQREYVLNGGGQSLAATYFGGPGTVQAEPFAMLHRG